MGSERGAVIDIGTNSVKLLVGDVSGTNIEPVLERSHQTRLGHGFYETHVLQADAIRATAEAVADFAAKARELGAQRLLAVATSAVRDARNSHELEQAVSHACGLSLRIITGEEEAEYAFQGVLTDPKFADDSLLLLDMGGGSTEFVLGSSNKVRFRHSFALGTLRLLDSLEIADPPAPGQFLECKERVATYLRAEVQPRLASALAEARAVAAAQGSRVNLVGTGGTAGILARIELSLDDYDRSAIEGVSIRLDRMRQHTELLWRLPLSQRIHVRGLPPSRADVILTGAAAYLGIMEILGFDSLSVSTRGLRFALLASLASLPESSTFSHAK